MATFVSLALTLIAALVAAPVAVFSLEVFAATMLPGATARKRAPDGLSPRFAVLVPAHNESAGLLPTLRDIQQQLRSGDRVLVVADNCTDDTAAAAAACGAETVERHDVARRGKGYALEFGLQHLSSDPPEVVIFIDADCRINEGTLQELATISSAVHCPAQALYLMKAPAGSLMTYQVAEFAWRIKNWLRPLGLRALRLPCQLMGAGMAFPWEVIRSVDLANGFLVEDLKLGLDLASKGYAPLFCPSAQVISQFAPSASADRTQRRRWEGGHLGLILTTIPQLLRKAATDWNGRLLALALDLAVPPLSLLALMVLGMFVVTTLYALLTSSWGAMTLSTVSFATFAAAAVVAWLKCGRDVLPPRAVFLIAPYVLGKLGLYRFILSSKSETQWIRTDRTKSE